MLDRIQPPLHQQDTKLGIPCVCKTFLCAATKCWVFHQWMPYFQGEDHGFDLRSDAYALEGNTLVQHCIYNIPSTVCPRLPSRIFYWLIFFSDLAHLSSNLAPFFGALRSRSGTVPSFFSALSVTHLSTWTCLYQASFVSSFPWFSQPWCALSVRALSSWPSQNIHRYFHLWVHLAAAFILPFLISNESFVLLCSLHIVVDLHSLRAYFYLWPPQRKDFMVID